MKTRMKTKSFAAALAFICLLAAPASRGFGQEPPKIPFQKIPPEKIPSREVFTYDLRVFLIPKAALGTLRFLRVAPNRYRAELTAETRGIVGLFTLYRKTHFISEIEYVPDKGRFLSRHYTKLVHRGPNVERTAVSIDHENGRVSWKIYFNDVLENHGVEPFPPGVRYEDLLSAFLNFRIGVYGPLVGGRKMTVLTLPDFADLAKNKNKRKEEDPFQKFEIHIVDEATEAAYRKRYGRTGEKGFLALVKIPKNLFGQKTGEVRIWFDKNVIPVDATIEDAILFGDIHGVLRKVNATR